MTSRQIILLLFTIFTFLGCHSGKPGKPDSEAQIDLEDRIDEYLQPYLATGNFTGAILVGRNGDVLLAKGYGMANYELEVPNTEDTVFHIASVSKSFTAAAILILEQRAKLSTGDPVSRFLEGYPGGERIMVHHLLTHTSGIPNINDFPEYEAISRSHNTTADLVARFRDRPLEFEPGKRYEYSNSNYNLLAHLIERITGKSYGEFLRAEIFQPLGMSNTGHDGDPAALIAHRASGYVPTGLAGLANAPYLDWSVKTGNGSLYSTVGDLFRWQRGLAEGKILGPESLAQAYTEHMENVGYGWFLRERFGGREIYINGRSPGFVSYLGQFPESGLCVVVLGNIYNAVATDVGRDIAAITLGQPYERPVFRDEPPDQDILKELVGTYYFGPDFYVPNTSLTFYVHQNHLFSDWGWMMPEGPMQFRDRTYWTRVEFQRDSEGEVSTVVIDGFAGMKGTAP